MAKKPEPEGKKEWKPARIVHLLGGLRAVDGRAESVLIQIAPNRQLLRFATPKYEQLYATLGGLSQTAIGVEFPHPLTWEGRMAADWECFFPTLGFRVMEERRAWSNIRHSASRSGEAQVYDAASRCVTYLDLLDIRLMELSSAYNRVLRAGIAEDTKPGHLFSNSYMREIDAAIHAFVADAGSFRDLIAEIVWEFAIRGDGEVTRFSSFIKKAKGTSSPVGAELLEAGEGEGWLSILTDLRNNIVHVAPVGRSAGFHFCEVREVPCGRVNVVPTLHYPLLSANGKIWGGAAKDMVFTSENEPAIKAALAEYKEYLAGSIDGLTYAWQTIQRFAELLTRIRTETELHGETPTITDKDIIGEVKVHPPSKP